MSKVFEEFVRLVLRGLAVVSCDRDIQVRRQHVAAQYGNLFENILRDDAGVRAFALGESDGYRRIFGIRRLAGGPLAFANNT